MNLSIDALPLSPFLCTRKTLDPPPPCCRLYICRVSPWQWPTLHSLIWHQNTLSFIPCLSNNYAFAHSWTASSSSEETSHNFLCCGFFIYTLLVKKFASALSVNDELCAAPTSHSTKHGKQATGIARPSSGRPIRIFAVSTFNFLFHADSRNNGDLRYFRCKGNA